MIAAAGADQLIHAGIAALATAVHDADRLAPQERLAAVTGLTGRRGVTTLSGTMRSHRSRRSRGRGAETAAGRTAGPLPVASSEAPGLLTPLTTSRPSSGRRPAAGWSFCSTVVTDGCMTSATVTEGGAGCCAGESAMVCSLDPMTLSGSGRRRTRRTRQNDDDVGGAAVGHHGGRARVRCGDLHPSDVACPGTRRFLA